MNRRFLLFLVVFASLLSLSACRPEPQVIVVTVEVPVYESGSDTDSNTDSESDSAPADISESPAAESEPEQAANLPETAPINADYRQTLLQGEPDDWLLPSSQLPSYMERTSEETFSNERISGIYNNEDWIVQALADWGRVIGYGETYRHRDRCSADFGIAMLFQEIVLYEQPEGAREAIEFYRSRREQRAGYQMHDVGDSGHSWQYTKNDADCDRAMIGMGMEFNRLNTSVLIVAEAYEGTISKSELLNEIQRIGSELDQNILLFSPFLEQPTSVSSSHINEVTYISQQVASGEISEDEAERRLENVAAEVGVSGMEWLVRHVPVYSDEDESWMFFDDYAQDLVDDYDPSPGTSSQFEEDPVGTTVDLMFRDPEPDEMIDMIFGSDWP